MTKFIFGVSLLVVVLAIGCFTFPLDEFSSSTFSSMELRSLPKEETTELPSARSFTDARNIETSTYDYLPLSHNEVPLKQRAFGGLESFKSLRFTTENPMHERDVPLSSFNSAEATTELIEHHLRSLSAENQNQTETEDDSENDKRDIPVSSFNSAEATTELIQHHLRSLSAENQNQTETEDDSENDKRDIPVSSFNSAEATTELIEHHLRSLSAENQNQTETKDDSENDKRDIPVSSFNSAEATTELIEHHLRSLSKENENEDDKRVIPELTTSYMPSFTSTSSDVAPKLYQFESSTSTQKYIGHLHESEEESTESEKVPKSKLKRTTEASFSAAQLDQGQADEIATVPSGLMNLQENAVEVTVIPATMKETKEQESGESQKPKLKSGRKSVPTPAPEDPLNQGKEPSFTEAPQPDN